MIRKMIPVPMINVQLGYEWNNVGVYLLAYNIFDEEYIDAANTLGEPATHTLGYPRQLSLSLRGHF